MISTPPPHPEIDRIAPTQRPDDWVVMRQRWAHLLFLHWEVPAESLRPLVPAGLDLDLFEGKAYVGLIPFTMTDIRPPGLPPVGGTSRAHEVNVRTYVHRGGRNPGVWFFSLDANNRLVVKLARWLFKLNYYHAKMSLTETEPTGGTPELVFDSQRVGPGPKPARCSMTYRPWGLSPAPQPGTLDFFLIERYILYAESNGTLYSGRVHHPPYPVQRVEVERLGENLIASAGLTRPQTPPLAHYAREVRVRIYPLRAVSKTS